MKNKSFLLLLAILMTVFAFSSCITRQTIANIKVDKTISLSSNPSGAMVYFEGVPIGVTPCTYLYHKNNVARTLLFGTMGNNVASKGEKYKTFVFKLDGFEDGYEAVNVLDVESGNYLSVHHDFTGGQEMVTRQAPGTTGMENTIIRWNFDSDPRGARISWRVISSIPEQVKNTNETYLSTTPYEETRSFNILGLTYNNSKDVTIEIKVSKRGYMDQVKRYNVRQSLDQQEISGFFELVPEE